MTPFETGSPFQDAQNAFQRERRRQTLERLRSRLRREPGDIDLIVPYEEVVEALGFVGEHHVGLRSVELDSIVGSVEGRGEFSRRFRPTSQRTRQRWQRIALAQRKGESMPPVDLYRIGEAHFVKDGHHRVSVARASGLTHIDAYVTEVRTKVGADRAIRLADLPLKEHERLFSERVPLGAAAHEVRLRDPWDYAVLAEAVEAWGFRLMQDRGELLSREQVARAWLDDEYRPVVAVLRESGLMGSRSEAEAYMRVVGERYRLLRTHAWSPEVWTRLERELR